MNGLWIVCVLAAVRGASVQSGNVHWFDLEAAQKHPEQLHILRAKAGINFQPYEQAWKEFKILHDKAYENPQNERHRFEIFKENVQKMEEHNKLYHLGKKSYYMGVNQFSDLTHEEFVKYNGLDKTFSKRGEWHSPFPIRNSVVPKSLDWRTKGCVTEVKDQGRCGSSWAFSTSGSLEGQHFLKTGKLFSLSQQQLLDCSVSFGNKGCNGGSVLNAYEYIASVGGMQTEDDYPYKRKEERCKFDHFQIVAKMFGYLGVYGNGSEIELKECVADTGPLSTTIDASHPSFQFYGGGVYDEPQCNSTHLNHDVLCVGYDTVSGGQDYWIVKNSWGEWWGESGYIKMSRNKNNQCGIATFFSYPFV